MNYKGLISSIAGIGLIAFSLMNGSGCANIIPPMGGPRDSLPPQLLKATPGDSTRNFSGNKITFTFDEFVDVQNIQENLSVSPLPKMNPSVEFKLNTVTVKLKDTLESNTTYVLNFGEAIKDYNEGNVLKKFTYTFSTGRYIDSLTFNGKVILAETGKVDSTLIVMLHTSPDDSSVVKEKPRYITKLNSTGTFVFKNLPPKTFYIYVLKDEGGTLRYFNDKQLFAFSDKPVVLPGHTEPVILYAYASKQSLPITGIPAISPGNRNNKTGGTVEKRLKYQTNLINNQQDLLGDFTMTFDQPLRSFDSSKIRLYTDSVYLPVTGYSFQKDSSNRKLQGVFTQPAGQSGWKENTAYHIILDKDFAEDSAGKKLLKKDTIHFKTKKLADYGALKIKFRNLDLTKNPVLLFVTGEAIFKSFPLSSAEFTQALFFPGEYELRILYDDNKNGTWDPGQFFGKHKQPEIVKPVERKVTVKPAWKNEFEIAL
ncbi:MAG: Ig-like domain-containing protein [Chitinophagaceae bacterium]|nr:Ig-like domain-containing protein [Chitinophagaceae bacterium]